MRRGPQGEFIAGLEAAAETAAWLYDKYPYIKAYLDEPKSLEELQRDVGKREKAYEVHHIVEQTAAERDGHSREEIDAGESRKNPNVQAPGDYGLVYEGQ